MNTSPKTWLEIVIVKDRTEDGIEYESFGGSSFRFGVEDSMQAHIVCAQLQLKRGTSRTPTEYAVLKFTVKEVKP